MSFVRLISSFTDIAYCFLLQFQTFSPFLTVFGKRDRPFQLSVANMTVAVFVFSVHYEKRMANVACSVSLHFLSSFIMICAVNYNHHGNTSRVCRVSHGLKFEFEGVIGMNTNRNTILLIYKAEVYCGLLEMAYSSTWCDKCINGVL